MREKNGIPSRFNTYVVDDGWNLPYEETEETDLRVIGSELEAYAEVCRQNRSHKGFWLTSDVARKYAAMSWIYREQNGNQYIGKVREIGEELRKLYGLTEIEARNILFERDVSDYVNKYDRIRNLIPLGVGNSAYDDEMIRQCVAM